MLGNLRMLTDLETKLQRTHHILILVRPLAYYISFSTIFVVNFKKQIIKQHEKTIIIYPDQVLLFLPKKPRHGNGHGYDTDTEIRLN